MLAKDLAHESVDKLYHQVGVWTHSIAYEYRQNLTQYQRSPEECLRFHCGRQQECNEQGGEIQSLQFTYA